MSRGLLPSDLKHSYFSIIPCSIMLLCLVNFFFPNWDSVSQVFYISLSQNIYLNYNFINFVVQQNIFFYQNIWPLKLEDKNLSPLLVYTEKYKYIYIYQYVYSLLYIYIYTYISVQSLSHVQLFVTPWTAVCQASLSITNSWSPPKPMSLVSVMPSSHLNAPFFGTGMKTDLF